MSRSESNGKCPDKGVWCGYVREFCEGDCGILLDERKDNAIATLRNALVEIRNLASDGTPDGKAIASVAGIALDATIPSKINEGTPS